MVTLGEFLIGKSLFAEIETIEPFPFVVGRAENLNLVLVINFGQQTLYKPYEELETSKIAELIVLQYKDVWQDYIKIQALKENVNQRREVTETINTLEDRINNREEVNKVSAFNSPDLIVNDGVNSNNVDNLEGVITRKLIDENIDPEKDYFLLSTKARDIIIKNVMSDIVTMLTLSIY